MALNEIMALNSFSTLSALNGNLLSLLVITGEIRGVHTYIAATGKIKISLLNNDFILVTDTEKKVSHLINSSVIISCSTNSCSTYSIAL